MSIVVTGLSHHTCPIEVRERLAFSAATLTAALLRLHKELDGGVVVLSTCNRVEIYAHNDLSGPELHRLIRNFFCEWHKVSESDFCENLYEYEGEDAVGHLFRVASSLDSLVVGEAQILGQVHDAYILAQAEQTTDKVLNGLFQQAFSLAKTVRSQTNIGSGKVSISSVAVDLAASIFMKLSEKTVMVVGSGEMGELTLKSLVSRGVSSVLVLNRSPERAETLAAEYNGQALPFDELPNHLHKADIVISTTASPRFVLHPENFTQALKTRAQRPIFVIDIAVPRDVDPAVGQLDNVYLYDIDDLQQVVNENQEARRKEMDTCLELVDREVAQFTGWVKGLAAEPTILSMSEELNAIRERELMKTLAALPDLTDKQRQEITYLSERIVRSILQRPMKHIKHEIGHHDPGTVIHLVKRLFGIEETS